MKRLLVIIGGGMDIGGGETFLMKLYRDVDRTKYQFDFCVSCEGRGFYDDEIKSLGGVVHHIVGKSRNPVKSALSLYKVIKGHNYKFVLRIGQNSLTVIDLVVAKIAGAKKLAYRSANSSDSSGRKIFIHRLFFPLGAIIPNVKIAPSDMAAAYMFGKRALRKGKVILLNNGISLNDYAFSEHGRKKIRDEFGINEEFVVGHIGRFAGQKNHRHIINTFKNILSIKEDAKLILIGEGELKSDIYDYVKRLGIEESVYFLGMRNDIPDVLSAMDAFVFPSFYEGMPNAVIEAQANGVPCFVSDTVSKSVQMCENVYMLSLDRDNWADAVINKSDRLPSGVNARKLEDCGYGIDQVTRIFVRSVFE